jgi:rfaE bifunctional protein nucleotidyltransferase chain/domain
MEQLNLIAAKIYTRDHLLRQMHIWRFKGKKIIFTNGCFDILHLGHVEYLAKARDMGSILIIGLNSDDSVRRLKGSHRPINDEDARSMVLAAFSFVDAVVIFDEDTPAELIEQIKPDVLVKGKDYEGKKIVGADFVKANGGEVVTIELTKGYSSTGIIQKAHLH